MEREEAIKKVRQMSLPKETMEILEALAPELKESEDERIRKELVNFILYKAGHLLDEETEHKFIAYLEKQKEEEGYEAIPVESTLEYKLGFKAGKESEKQKEQKPAWSEEDEDKLEQCIRIVRGWEGDYDIVKSPYSNFLKSLRPQPKAELTLLDKNIISAAVAFVEQNDHFNCWGGIDKHTIIKALRSLRPSWKPRKELLDALHTAAYLPEMEFYGGLKDKLRELHEQLKRAYKN